MTPHSRSSRRGPGWAVTLLAAFTFGLSIQAGTAAPLVRPAATSPTEKANTPAPWDNLLGPASEAAFHAAGPSAAESTTQPVPTRVEGRLQSISADAWTVDQKTVRLTPETSVLEKRGAAEVGAWVVVWGQQQDAALVADIIHVLQPAGAPAPVYQFTGALRKMISPLWVVGDTVVTVTTETTVISEPQLDALVQVTGQRDGYDLLATEIKVLAADPTSVPVAIKGLLEVANEAEWTVDGRAIVVPQTMRADAQPGDWVEVRALESEDGSLVAQETRVVDPESITQVQGYLSAIDAGQEAAPQALPITATEPSAAAVTEGTGWRNPVEIVSFIQQASRPTVLIATDGSTHAVFESLGVIYYVSQPPKGAWGRPRRIGIGAFPTAVFDAKGRLHIAYVSEFMGNYDILHARLERGVWTLPVLVAPTSGRSADPALAAAPDGSVHLAWMDTTSGDWAIQTGVWDGRYWTTAPVPNARGQSPALTVLSDGNLFLVWQDRMPSAEDTWGKYDIFASERSKGGFWSLPVNVSDNAAFHPGSDSLGPQVSATLDGMAHIAWIDNKTQVRYAGGRGLYWPRPADVGTPRPLARGLSMRLAPDGLLYLAWDEGALVRVTSAQPLAQSWRIGDALTCASSSAGEIVDASLNTGRGGVAVTWVKAFAQGGTAVYESRHNVADFTAKVFLPLAAGR